MSPRLASVLAAAALVAAALPALASGSTVGHHDDTTYPDVPARFATGTDAAPIVTADVTYPGPHATVAAALPAAALPGALARHDDTAYPTADAPLAADPAERLATQPRDENAACACGRS